MNINRWTKIPYEVFWAKLQDVIIFELLAQNILFIYYKRSARIPAYEKPKRNLFGYWNYVDDYRVWFKGTIQIEWKRELVFSRESILTTKAIAFEPEQLMIDKCPTPDSSGIQFDAVDISWIVKCNQNKRNRTQLNAPEHLIECRTADEIEPEL